MKKKGQLVQPNPQSMIALLIFIIGLALILYILFLPPDDRADLLDQNRTSTDDGEKDDITILLTKEPGRLTNLAEDEIIQDLPSFSLFTRTDADTLIEFDSIYIKKSLFEEQKRNISFMIDNFENTDNFVLSFTVPKHKGVLTVILNEGILLSKEITTISPAPIKLPKDYLKNQNSLVFKVSGPGIEFWKSNEYNIENMKITADITDKTSQENKQIILVTEQEKDNLESFELRLVADCRALETGPMEIYLNKRLIYSGVPDCGIKIEVPPVDAMRLREGENDLLFRTEKGNYMLYGIETKLKLKEPLFPTYFFSLETEEFENIKSDDADINLTLLFPNSVDRKKGVVLVNDYFMEIETYESSYERKINEFIRDGNNAVEIRAEQEKLDVLELEVILVE